MPPGARIGEDKDGLRDDATDHLGRSVRKGHANMDARYVSAGLREGTMAALALMVSPGVMKPQYVLSATTQHPSP